MRRSFVRLATLLALGLAAPLSAQISLTTIGSPSTQNFDSLLTAGAANPWTDNSTLPGWYAQFSATPANPTTYRADSGGSNTGAIYSWGVAATNPLTERAFGSVSSGTPVTVLDAVRLVNNTGVTITSLAISYDGEQWRDGGAVTPVAQTTFFEYQVANAGVITDANTPTTGWTSFASLDFTSPTFTNTGAGAALDGNAVANRTAKAATLTVTVTPGQEVWLRWRDINDAGNDHGLGVDNFSVTPQAPVNAPIVPSCPASIVTFVGSPASAGVSASDSDGTVTSATITLITPSNPGTITLTGFTPAGGVGGTANATLNVSNTTPVGSYTVTIQWANNDVSPQTATCSVGVTVTALTLIHDVQGNGSATPMPGATVTVEGVVIGNYQGTGTSKLRGFFLEEETATDWDANPATSEGIFIFCDTCPTPVAEGQRVRVTGVVSEFFNKTEITADTAPSVVVTNAGNNLALVTPASIDLPVVGVVNDFYETMESMRVTFVDSLSVSEYFEMARFGHFILYEGGRPRQFTEQSPPSMAGLTAHLDNLSRRKVIVDDDNNRQNAFLPAFGGPPDGSQFVFHPRANGGFSVGTQGTDFFRGGDLVNGLTGVLDWDFPGTGANTWRIRPTAATPVAFTVNNTRPATAPAVGGAIKAAAMNLLNYFTTIEPPSDSCGPSANQDCRGADSVAELNRQRERASIVICGLNADAFGFMELDNSTASGAITDLLGAVNTRCGGAHPYAAVGTASTLGTDAIRVQIVYRTGILSPVGATLFDMDPVHNRPPTAQTFDVVDAANPAFGQRFTVIANHFKSKGCPGTGGDADVGDGQGCFNATRTAQATRLLAWISSTVLPAASDPDVLLLGDFNSYAKEDPVTTLQGGGFNDLETTFQGANAYSYLFDGQLGHIDYGFASASLLAQVTGANTWHINADEAPLFDYNDELVSGDEANFEEKPDGSTLAPPRVVFQPASPYRASDHDPVLVGLFLISDVAITKTDGVTTATPGGSVTYTITASNSGPDPVTGGTVADTFPASLTCTWTCVGAGGGTCTAAGSGNINDTVNLPVGGSVTYTASCTISAAATGTLSNTATVSGGANGDPNPANNSATDVDTLGAQADLAVTKTDGVTTATPGGSVTYTITASNAGPSNATGSTVADTFPASLTCNWTCVGAGGGTCTAAGSGNINDTVNLPAGGSVTYTASCTISAAATGSLSNTATVAAPGGVTDPSPANNSATDTDALGGQADLSITKTDGVTSTTPGGSVTYTITASNAGPSNATGSTVADTFPASLTCNWTCVGAGGGTCTAAGSGNINDTVNLPVGGSVTYTASCNVSPAATGSLVNTATVTAPGGVTDPTPGNNSATDTDALQPVADLSIAKTDGVTTATPGGSVTYTITASNEPSGSDAPGSTVSDTFPASLTCTWTCVGAGGGTCTAAGSGNINDTVNLPQGASVTYTASCTVSASATGTISNTASVTPPPSVVDDVAGNNSATDVDNLGGASVSGTKTASGTFDVGGTVTYTVTLSNAGPAQQADNPGNEFTDVLPPTLALVSATASSGTAVPNTGTNTVTWNGSIPASGSVTITITATILPSAAGQTVSNQGTIAFDGDGNGTNESTAQTDDPATGSPGDPTAITVAGIPVAIIPVLDWRGLLALAALLGAAGALWLRRR